MLPNEFYFFDYKFSMAVRLTTKNLFIYTNI